MPIVARLVDKAMRRVVAYLNQPYARYAPAVPTDIDRLACVLVPGDVLLVDGNTRFAALVKHLTQSTWSHVAMYVGPLSGGSDPICVVEADIENGVRGVALSEFRGMHVRVVRAIRLANSERAEVARRVAARIGQAYDLDCAVCLARSLWPLHDARSDAIPMPTANRAICSTLLARAFEEVGYPILPPNVGAGADVDGASGKPRVHTPRDFDLSPFFAIVPPLTPQRIRPRPATPAIEARPSAAPLFSAPVLRRQWSCRRPSRRASSPHGSRPLPRTCLPVWPSRADSRSSAESRA